MILTLFRKELRHLLPIAILFGILACLSLVIFPMAGRPDEFSWLQLDSDLRPGHGMGSAIALMLLGLMTAYSLFPREHDEGTIHFLHALPVHRSQIFAAKMGAALTILWGGIVLGLSIDWFLQCFNSQSFTGGDFHLSIALPLAFLHLSYLFIVLSHGVLLSFFRRFGLVLYGLIWLTIFGLEERWPALRDANVLKVLSLAYHGQTLLLPWNMLTLHLGIAAVATSLGYVLWSVPAETVTHMYQQLSTRFWGRACLLAGSLGVGVIVLALAYQINQKVVQEQPSVSYPTVATARFDTQHYRFTYPANLSSTAMALMREADAAYDAIRLQLGASETSPIVADLTEQSTEHAGIAGWQKLRMNLQGNLDPASYLRTLYHETTHVFEATESDRRLHQHAQSALFFAEGLAEHVAFKAVPNPSQLADQRLLAAVSWRRQRIRFDDIVDLDRFKAVFHENLFYVLGELWVHALSEVCGDPAPGRALRAMARDDAPQDLSGRLFWQDTLQAIQCDIEAVNSAWEEQMITRLEANPADADRLPHLAGGVTESQEDEIVLVATLDRSPDDLDTPFSPTFSIRVRHDSSAAEQDVQTYSGTVRDGTSPLEVVFRVPAQHVQGRRFEFQFGYAFAPWVMSYYELWQSAAH